MAAYREIAPSPRLARTIECFWISQPESDSERLHRVLPDGCADILFTRDDGTATIEAVGPMTHYQDFPQHAGRLLVGVRFRPGTWTSHLGIPGDQITDETLPLDCLWGSRARDLRDQFAEADTVEQSIGVLEGSLPVVDDPGPVLRALEWMAQRHGCVPVDELADRSGLSSRQFRRICLTQTGLTPKFLARVLRFRHALARVQSSEGARADRSHPGAFAGRSHPCAFAHLALDCGYYDQAHFINEFRELSGRTPTASTDGRFFQSP